MKPFQTAFASAGPTENSKIYWSGKVNWKLGMSSRLRQLNLLCTSGLLSKGYQ